MGSLTKVTNPKKGALIVMWLLGYQGIYVKRRGGDYVQWGETRDAVNEAAESFYGPDVHSTGSPPAAVGIFGLTHEELLQSEWVEDDTLTAKFVLEVRPNEAYLSECLDQTVEVPAPTVDRDLRALLDEGTCSDLQFRVQGEVIHAHSQVLCARSEVFKLQLSSGMQESVSKVIVIEDCDVTTFKSFLRFLYTDSLPTVEELIEPAKPVREGNRQSAVAHALWAVSHKYLQPPWGTLSPFFI